MTIKQVNSQIIKLEDKIYKLNVKFRRLNDTKTEVELIKLKSILYHLENIKQLLN